MEAFLGLALDCILKREKAWILDDFIKQGFGDTYGKNRDTIFYRNLNKSLNLYFAGVYLGN